MIENLKKLKIGKVIPNPKMSDYTTYKVGGYAIALVYPDDTKDLIKLLTYLKTNNIKYKILGNGSNLIFSDNKYEGVLIKLSEFDKLDIIYKIDLVFITDKTEKEFLNSIKKDGVDL